MLNDVLKKEPEHPGVTHYLIHACDNPKMAYLSLPAARRYAAIAPAAPHALHMPSHIFARLGLWQEDIQSNLASKAAAEKLGPMHAGAENRLHAMDFLEYAYLQIGEDAKAKAIIAEAEMVRPGDLDQGFGPYLGYVHAHFPAMYALETRHWKHAEALQPLLPQSRCVRQSHIGRGQWARGIYEMCLARELRFSSLTRCLKRCTLWRGMCSRNLDIGAMNGNATR